MKFIFFMIGSVFSLSSTKLCTNCKYFIKPTGKTFGACSLFPVMDNNYIDCVRSRKIYYMCGEKGRYYEDSDKPSDQPSDQSSNQPSDHPSDHV